MFTYFPMSGKAKALRCRSLTLSLLMASLCLAVCSRARADDPESYVPPPHTLARAAYDGNLPLVRKMLAQNPSQLNTIYEGMSPLSLAALHNRVEVVRYLLANGAKVSSKSAYLSPLANAVAVHSRPMIDMLLAKGADIKQPYVLLGATDDPPLFRYLVAKGADIHSQIAPGDSLLRMTVNELNIETTRILLEGGLDVNIGMPGISPLCLLTFHGSAPPDKVLAVARLLLDKGADPNLTDQLDHRTVLAEAVMQRFLAMVRLLLTYESPVRCSAETLKAARKALHLTATGNVQSSYTDTDLQKNKPLTKKEVAALHEISTLLNEPLPELPVTEAEITLPSGSLFASAYNGDLKALQKLVKAGSSLKAKDKDGRTPLHYAALGGRLDVARWLLANGAEINARDAHDATPLALAHQDTQDAPLADRRAALISFLTEKGGAE